jgi:hypothetical protein
MSNMRDEIGAARVEIKEINTGITARLLNLESNAVSKIEINPRLETIEQDITDLRDSRIDFRATIRAWVIIGGGVWSIAIMKCRTALRPDGVERCTAPITNKLFHPCSPQLLQHSVPSFLTVRWFTKYITSISSTAGKRFLLAILALVGVISYSALNGTPLDVNSVSSIAQVLLTTAGAFLAAHGSYSLLTGKTEATEVPNA